MQPFQLNKRWFLCSDEHNFTLSERVSQKQKDGSYKEVLVPRSYFSSIDSALKDWSRTSVRDIDADLITALKETNQRLKEIKECLNQILT